MELDWKISEKLLPGEYVVDWERAEGVFEAKSNSSGVRLTLKNPDNLRLQGNAGELSLKFFQRKVLD